MIATNPAWTAAKVYYGDGTQRCGKCWEFIKEGEWVKVHKPTAMVIHDDEAEDMGAYS